MNDPLVVQCACCRLVKAGEDFVEASPAPWVKVSHGYCPECFRIQMQAVADLIAEEKGRAA